MTYLGLEHKSYHTSTTWASH